MSSCTIPDQQSLKLYDLSMAAHAGSITPSEQQYLTQNSHSGSFKVIYVGGKPAEDYILQCNNFDQACKMMNSLHCKK